MLNRHRAVAALSTVFALSLGATASAQVVEVQPVLPNPPAPERATAEPPSGTVGVEPTHAAMRAENLDDLAVVNGTGRQIGEVKDVVLDVNTGAVRYVAVSCGEFLGLGGKLFAIPWGAMEMRYDPERREHFLFLRATKDDMARAPGFPSDRWPNFADERWTNENDTYFLKYKVIREPVLIREPKGQPVAPAPGPALTPLD